MNIFENDNRGFKIKIHRVTVTGADINYIGSISIDKLLIEAANLVIGEKVNILNINNGESLKYIVEVKEGQVR